jgi:hypothetical protein
MDDAAIMGVLHRQGKPPDQFGGLTGRQRPRLQAIGQCAALHIGHRKVALPFVLAYLVDGDDVLVLDLGRRLRLGAEALYLGGGRQPARRDHLQGDNAVEADLPRLVDDAHAAARDLREQFIVAEGGARTLGGSGPQRRRELLDTILIGEVGFQVIGKLGMGAEQFVPLRRLAGVDCRQVGGQHLA